MRWREVPIGTFVMHEDGTLYRVDSLEEKHTGGKVSPVTQFLLVTMTQLGEAGEYVEIVTGDRFVNERGRYELVWLGERSPS